MHLRKFLDGERVRLLPDARAIKLRHDGIYKVIRAMPQEGLLIRYRIKHEDDPFERVVSETQIVSATAMEGV